MKQEFTKHIGRQQYWYIGLAIVGMCFAGASLVLAEEDTASAAVTSSASVNVNVRQDAHAEQKAAFEATKAERDQMLTERKEALAEKRAAFEAAKEARASEMEAKRSEIAARIAERKAALTQQVQERIKMLGSNLTKRFEAAITHLSEISVRVETQLEKKANAGVDTADATLLIAEARQKLEEAKTLIAELNVEVEYTVTSETPRAEWAAAKEEFQAVHVLLKETRALLREAVAALKTDRPAAAEMTETETASTTAE